jgi:hypothetical protein
MSIQQRSYIFHSTQKQFLTEKKKFKIAYHFHCLENNNNQKNIYKLYN